LLVLKTRFEFEELISWDQLEIFIIWHHQLVLVSLPLCRLVVGPRSLLIKLLPPVFLENIVADGLNWVFWLISRLFSLLFLLPSYTSLWPFLLSRTSKSHAKRQG
jgi:hypothetical protein